MAPHPGIRTDQIKEKARKDLLDLIEGIRGKKNLVIEKALAGPVGILVKFSTLQEHGIDKVFIVENNNVDASQKNIIFLARGEKASVPIAIAEQIKRIQSNSNNEHEFTIIWVPRRTLVCDKILEESGVLGDVSVEVFPLHFIPLEQDLLSLCLDDAFSDLYLAKDPTSVFLSALALMPIQHIHGLFPRIIGKGDNAHRLMELLLRMRSEAAADDSNPSKFGMMPSANIESLIIIDREIDFATPLLTQLTYEGLIDEVFGIEDNQAAVDTSIIGTAQGSQAQGKATTTTPTQQGLKRKIWLDSTDKLYSQLRDTNFAIVDSLLNKVARRLQSDMESRHTAKSTSELRDFVNKLPGYQSEQASLKTHIALTEDILKYTQSDLFRRVLEVQQNLVDGTDPSSQHETIEELIARSIPLPTILRLLCLESTIAGGLRQKDLDSFKRQILHAYGHQHLLTLSSLEKIGLLSTRGSANVLLNPIGVGTAPAEGTKTNYNYLRKMLRLIVDEVNEQNPNDISYVYSGYAPLSIRLVQALVQKQHLQAITRSGNASSSSTTASAAASSSAKNGGSGVIASAGGGPSSSTTASTTAHGWQGFEDALRNVRGATFNKVQKGEEQAVKARHMLTGSGGGGSKPKTILVMFLGGITFTEVAALRFLAKQIEDGGRRMVICTTGMVSGGSIIDGVIEKGDFGKG